MLSSWNSTGTLQLAMQARILACALAALLLTALTALVVAGPLREQDTWKVSLPRGSQPEGIAAGDSNDLWVACLSGSIIHVDLSSNTTTVVHKERGVHLSGIKFCAQQQLLFVASTLSGKAYLYLLQRSAGPAGASYSVRKKEVLELGLPGASYINDVAISNDKVYFTDSFNPVLYQIPRVWATGSSDVSHPIMNLLGAPAATARPISKIHTGHFFDTKPGQFRANGAAVYSSNEREDVLLVACTHTGNVYKVVVSKLLAVADTPAGPASVAVAAAAAVKPALDHLSQATVNAASDFLTGLGSLQRPSVAPVELASLAAQQSAAAPATVGIASLPIRTRDGKPLGKQSSKWAQLSQEVQQDLERSAKPAQQAIRTAGRSVQQAAVSTASTDSADSADALPDLAVRSMSIKDAAEVVVKAGETVKVLGQIAKGLSAQVQQQRQQHQQAKETRGKVFMAPDYCRRDHHGRRHSRHAIRHYMREHPDIAVTSSSSSSSSSRSPPARSSGAPAAGSGGAAVQAMRQNTKPAQLFPAAGRKEVRTQRTPDADIPDLQLPFPAGSSGFTARPAAQAFVQTASTNSRKHNIQEYSNDEDDSSSSSSSSDSDSMFDKSALLAELYLNQEEVPDVDYDTTEGTASADAVATAAAGRQAGSGRQLLTAKPQSKAKQSLNAKKQQVNKAKQPRLLAAPVLIPEGVPEVDSTLRKHAAVAAARAAIAADHNRGLYHNRGLLAAEAASEAASMDMSPAQLMQGIAGNLPWLGKKHPAAEVTELPLPSVPGRFSQRLLVDGISVLTDELAFVADNYNNRVWGLQLGEGLADAQLACDFQGPPMQVPTTLAMQSGRLWWVNAHLDTCFPFLPCPLHTFELHGVDIDLCQPWG